MHGIEAYIYKRNRKSASEQAISSADQNTFCFYCFLIKRQSFIMNGIFWRRLKWEVFFFCLYINWQTTKWGGGGGL